MRMRSIISFKYLTISLNPNSIAFPIRFAVEMTSKSSSSSSKMVVEYAKSGRSSCKQCSNAIVAGALRLGSVTRDSRGFDMTKWHHLQCFPLNSDSVGSPESIKGFPALKVYCLFFFFCSFFLFLWLKHIVGFTHFMTLV